LSRSFVNAFGSRPIFRKTHSPSSQPIEGIRGHHDGDGLAPPRQFDFNAGFGLVDDLR